VSHYSRFGDGCGIAAPLTLSDDQLINTQRAKPSANEMSIQSVFIKALKPLAKRTVYREGAIRTILTGPCRGLKYRIFPQFGLSYLYGGWEPEAQAIMLSRIKQGETTYDIGANYGMHALLMAKLVGASGHVYAFEPSPPIFEALVEQMQMNGFHHVECFQAGIWDHSGTAAFLDGHHLGAGHCAEIGAGSGSRTEIAVLSLDDFVFEKGYCPPDFIKVDVEGAESKVLSGARRVLETFRPVLLIDLHSPEQDVAVGTTLAQLGYKARRTTEQNTIVNMLAGWPEVGGMWGQIVAMHQSSPTCGLQ
jgi:FkbM family methyltransferase